MSSDGTGQVLIFPYYTVNNNYNTLITIINTTENSKALRVRFREAANGREVYAYNLYLGPFDVWVGGLYKSGEEDGYVTKMINADDSCTVPQLAGDNLHFYDDNFDEDYGDDLFRMYEGFMEVIEMGELTGDSALATVFNDEQPQGNCNLLQQAWEPGGYWDNDSQTDLLPPSGGITGSIELINVLNGVAISEPVTALKDFSDVILHFSADNDSPALSDSKLSSTITAEQGNSLELHWETGYESVSSVLMKTQIMTEYVLTDGIGAQTEWMVSFPTRQYFVDELYIGQSPFPIPPFAGTRGDNVYTYEQNNNTIFPDCEVITTTLYDREEQGPEPRLIIRPPTSQRQEYLLCFSVNSIPLIDDESYHSGFFGSQYPVLESWSFNTDYRPATDILVSIPAYPATPQTPATQAQYFDTGWLALSMAQAMFNTQQDIVIGGLPVIGFSVQQYTNGNLGDGVLANYAGSFENKYKTLITVMDDNPIEADNEAMSLSQDGTGQVLIYPYYTVRNNLNTLISVVNTTDSTKAIKVRFYEGKNSRTCLDFNVYLSPYDVWTSGLVLVSATALYSPGFEGHETAKIVTNDNSCTDPAIISGYEFLPWSFSGDNLDPLGDDLSRCTEGHFEIIEMGVIGDATIGISTTQYGILHDNGRPNDCGVLIDNWSGLGTLDWSNNANDGFEPPTGGLYGSASLIDVDSGTDAGYDAIAINGYSNQPQHTNPGSLLPDLSTGNVTKTSIETDNGVLKTNWQTSVDAVSALFMSSQKLNDFVISDNIGAETEWITTFPTKRFYVDPNFSGSALPIPPFKIGLSEFGSCENHRFKAFGREQQLGMQMGPVAIFDPPPPNYNIFPEYCWSVNVSDVNQGDNENSILDSQLWLNDWQSDPDYASVSDLSFDTGWMQTDYVDEITNPSKLTGTGDNGEIHEFFGKPVVGFNIQKYVNGALGDENTSVLANYAVIKRDKYKRKIVITE